MRRGLHVLRHQRLSRYAFVDHDAKSSSAHLTLFGQRVDLSYGVYLYGWPVAQALLYFTHQKLSPVPLFTFTIAVTLVVAYGSWRLIERPSLDLLKRQKRAVSFA